MHSLSRVIVCAVLLSPLSFGDTIVSGWIHATDRSYPTAGFRFVGPNFEFTGSIEGGEWPTYRRVRQGELHSIDVWAPTFWMYPPPFYGGRYRPELLFDISGSFPWTEMFISGPAVQINGPGTYTSPFTMQMRACGVELPVTPNEFGFYDCDLLVQLEGRGTATLFVDEPPWDELRVYEAHYNFENIPEPASIGLAALGFAALWWVKSQLRSSCPR